MTWNDDTSDTPDFDGGFTPGGDTPAERDDTWPADGLDRLIAESARDYNAPPPTVPRDAMWEAIMAARPPQARTPEAAPIAPVAAVAPASPRAERGVVSLADRRAQHAERSARNRGLVAVAAAAAIFLATGIGIGRWWGPGETVARTDSTAARVASAPAPAPAVSESAVSESAVSESAVPDSAVPGSAVSGPPRVAARRPAERGTAAPRVDLYDVALVRHFAQAEALLVSYRADTVDAATDSRLAAWARPLLGDTRLLLDSPAARDPRRRRLLEDLELVLAELARLAPAGPVASADSAATAPSLRAERQSIDGTLRRAQLLPRLRTLVPAGT